MANLMLNSEANGTWWYEIEEGKIKVKYPIKPGFQEIPESHIKTLESDPGYNTMVAKQKYKILKGGKAKLAAKADEKEVEAAKKVSDAKQIAKDQIAESKKEHVAEMKKAKDEHNSKYQEIVNMRGEALQQVKALEKEKVVLEGEKAGFQKQLDGKDKEIKKLQSELKAAKEAK